jgi:hypothetical protein
VKNLSNALHYIVLSTQPCTTLLYFTLLTWIPLHSPLLSSTVLLVLFSLYYTIMLHFHIVISLPSSPLLSSTLLSHSSHSSLQNLTLLYSTVLLLSHYSALLCSSSHTISLYCALLLTLASSSL